MADKDIVNEIQKRILDDDFSKYLLVADETSAVLKCHLAIESFLDKLLMESLQNPKKILNKGFSNKVEILYAMGLVGIKTTEKVFRFNVLRNKIAHQYKYTLGESDLIFLDSCNPEGEKIEGTHYEIVISKLLMAMVHILTLLELGSKNPSARDII